MNYYKQLGKNRKKEELPSFLVGLTDAPEDITFATKPTPSTHYLGPIFVGLCSHYQHHAPPHSLKLGSFHQPQFIMLPGADDISKLLYTQTKVDKVTQTMNVSKPVIKRQKIFRDIYPHKCTGSKKMFIPDITPHIIDLGKTQSIIEGETSFEIPLSRSQNVPFRYRRKSIAKRENEFITLSDVREERRMYMSYKERIAHAHFPKEFTTVRVIGPTIPASITITKLPTKRKTESQLTFELKSGTEKVEPTKETDKIEIRRKSTRSRSATISASKKFSRKSVFKSFENLEKPEEEIEIRGEGSVEADYVIGEEVDEEGEEREEVEGEKEEIEEEEKEEEIGETKSDIKETKSDVKERKSDVKAKKSVSKERKSIAKERKSVVKETKSDLKETRSDVKETKSDVKETKSDVKERKSDVKAKKSISKERKSIAKERKSIAKERKSDVKKEEMKTEIKEEPEEEVEEEELEEEVKEEPKAEITEEGTKAEVKEEPKAKVKEEPKTEVKEEPKAEVKEEPKAEVKEEPKAEVKEEPKAEVKEEKKAGVKEEKKAGVKEEKKAGVKEEKKAGAKEEKKTEVKEEKIKQEDVSEDNTKEIDDDDADVGSTTSSVVHEATE